MVGKRDNKKFHMIYIASCGEGINAYHLVQSAIIQFPENDITIVKVPHIRSKEQIDDLVEKARDSESIIVHTMVQTELRQYITRRGIQKQVVTIDLMGPVLSKIQTFLNKNPIEKPGLYRTIHHVNLTQVSAIEFALAQDDGMNPQNLPNAEIILVGLSRAGKTPLSMYMAVLGWKVANVPYVPSLSMPDTMDQIDRRRIIFLHINQEQLMAHRKMRQNGLGIKDIHSYTSKKTVEYEIEQARKYFVSRGYSMIDVSNKPIESSAEEIIEMITRRFKTDAHKLD